MAAGTVAGWAWDDSLYGGAMETIRWGVLAPGRIARNFARDLALVPDAELVAPAPARQERADAFAGEFGGAAYSSYEELVADPAVDVVYVASPHTLHVEHTMLALDAGKAVLCEKPTTLDAASTQALFDAAGRARAVPDGGDVDGDQPRDPHAAAAARPTASTAPRGRCTPTSASSSTPARTTGCSTRPWAPGRCSTWASTR